MTTPSPSSGPTESTGAVTDAPIPWDAILDALPLVFSLTALAFTAATFFFNRHRDKRDLFLKMHERQVDVDIQEGRRLLYYAVRPENAIDFNNMRHDPKLSDQYAKINRSLAMLDVMGLYVDKNYINEKDVLEEWGRSLITIEGPAMKFISHRSPNDPSSAWPRLQKLIRLAKQKYPDAVVTPAATSIADENL